MTAAPAPTRTRRWLLPALALVAIVVAVGLALFQPWKLWVDDVVDEAAPVGLAVASTPTGPAPTTTPAPTTSAPPDSPATPETPAPTTAEAPTTSVPAADVPAPPAEPAPTSFRSKAHATSGTVRLLTLEDGSRVLRIEDLDTDNGPDLKVVLSTDPDGYTGEGAVSLGTLKGNKGSQNYEIPADVDLSTLRSVVIWCKRFDSDFGVAALPA